MATAGQDARRLTAPEICHGVASRSDTVCDITSFAGGSPAGQPVQRPSRLANVGGTTGPLFGVDLSNNNWGGRPPAAIVPTLTEIIREGFSFIAHKVSEGNYFIDRYWPTVLSWARSTASIVIGYHYVTTNNAAQQANTYLSNVGDRSVPCMLDFEASGGGIGNFWAVWNAFTAAGVNMRLSYIPRWYWQQIGSPDLSNVVGLVASDYVVGTGFASVLYPGSTWPGWNPYGGATPVILQFTDRAQVAGLLCDADAFRGTLAGLQQLLTRPPAGTATD